MEHFISFTLINQFSNIHLYFLHLFIKKLLIKKILIFIIIILKRQFLTFVFLETMHHHHYIFFNFFTKISCFIYKPFDYVKNTLHLYTSLTK